MDAGVGGTELVSAGALAWGAGSFAWPCSVWQAVPTRSSAAAVAVNSLSFFIPMFIYDLHATYTCNLPCRPVGGIFGQRRLLR
jgi:hypothetical protein